MDGDADWLVTANKLSLCLVGDGMLGSRLFACYLLPFCLLFAACYLKFRDAISLFLSFGSVSSESVPHPYKCLLTMDERAREQYVQSVQDLDEPGRGAGGRGEKYIHTTCIVYITELCSNLENWLLVLRWTRDIVICECVCCSQIVCVNSTTTKTRRMKTRTNQ